jgi:monoamine oxidase
MHTDVDTGGRLEADVAIVGGGLAGLMAARTVAAAGLQPIVLEARDRIGGRTVNQPIGDGAIVEMGGQYIPEQDARLRALVAELELDLFPVYDRGAHLLELGRGVRSYRGKLPRVRPLTLLDIGRARLRMDRSAKRVPTKAPWAAPRAREWDTTNLGEWLNAHVRTADGRALLAAAFTTIWAEDPHGLNLLGALSRIHEAGGFENLTQTRGGMLQDRVVGGATRIADALAFGLDVACGRPVDAIVDHGSSVELSAAGTRVTARRAIVAVPPVLARWIKFEPGLPHPRLKALAGLPPGSVIKVALVYDRPFWRDRGLSGRALTVEGPITSTLDNSPPDGEPGVLVGFVPGARARALAKLPPAERREAVLAAFAHLFGPEAGRPEQYLEKDWNADPWSRGCYQGLPAPGVVTELFPTFVEPVGRIHWAGTETTFESFGGMNGALISGERAAGEVLAALSAGVEAVAAR